MPVGKCIVTGCTTTGRNCKSLGLRMLRMPAEKISEWLHAINESDVLQSIPVDIIREKKRICSRHFAQNCFMAQEISNLRVCLKPNAVPSLFLRTVTGSVLTETTNGTSNIASSQPTSKAPEDTTTSDATATVSTTITNSTTTTTSTIAIPTTIEESNTALETSTLVPATPTDEHAFETMKKQIVVLTQKLLLNPLTQTTWLKALNEVVQLLQSKDVSSSDYTGASSKGSDIISKCESDQMELADNTLEDPKEESHPFVFVKTDVVDALQKDFLDTYGHLKNDDKESTNLLSTFENGIDGTSISVHSAYKNGANSAKDTELDSTKDSFNVTNTQLVQIVLKSMDNSDVETKARAEVFSSSLGSLKTLEESSMDQEESQTAYEVSGEYIESISSTKAMLMDYDLPKLEVVYSETEDKQKAYPCCYCNLCFSKPSDRKSHIESHSLKVRCPICSIEFFSHTIVQHLVDIHRKKRNTKNVAPKESIPEMARSLLNGLELPELITVYDKRLHKNVFPCCYCSDVFYSKTERENHLQNHGVKAQCPWCLKEFTSHKIMSHVKSVHVKSASNKRKDFCELCNGFYSDLSRHCTDRHSNSLVIRRFCVYCENAAFETSEELLSHYEANHDDEKLDCGLCDNRIFSFQQKKHMLEHGPRTKKLCPHCGKLFLQLAQHVNTVHKGQKSKCLKPVQCDQCAKFLHSKQKLRFHYLSFHSPDLKCDTCDQKFDSLRALNGHKRKLHKPHGDYFLKKRNVKRKQPPSGKAKVVMVKCFVCKRELGCSRLFDHLVHHVWKEIGHMYDRQLQFAEQDVACPTCDAQFQCTYHLANHMTRHLDPARVHECPNCFRTFKLIRRFDFHKKYFCRNLEETIAYTMHCREKNLLCKNKLLRRRKGRVIDAE